MCIVIGKGNGGDRHTLKDAQNRFPISNLDANRINKGYVLLSYRYIRTLDKRDYT